MLDRNVLVSVIVPVYNVEAYLERCLDSICIQSFKDIEIILIDDGSTDGTAAICDRYANTDERIRVIHKSNEGLSAARNNGIDMACSDYIMFVDGDDWVEPDFCEIPYKLAVESGADLVMFETNQYKYKGLEEVSLPEIEGEEGCILKQRAMDYINVFRWSSWSKFYSRKLFETIRFPEGKVYEDMGTTHRIVHASECIYLSHAKLYNHVLSRPGSIISTDTEKNSQDEVEMYIRRTSEILKWGYNVSDKYVFRSLVFLGHVDGLTEELEDRMKRIGMGSKDFTVKQKMMLLTFRISPDLFGLICKASGKRSIAKDDKL